MAHNQFELLRQRRFLPYFVVQALGAFNDNVFRQAIIGLLGYVAVAAEDRTLYTNLAPAVFILPYFLFSATAGQIAEKLEKSRLIRITTAMEIAVMSIAAVGFLTQNMSVLLIALFCTGVQSTLFGPVKYSILPSVLKPEELTGGNGLVEMGTSMAILLGMIVGGLVFVAAGANGPLVASLLVIALAVTGNLVSRTIPPVAASAPELRINWNPIPESLAIWRLTRKQAAVRNGILGVSWFWFVGTVLTSNLPTYAEANLGGGPTLYVFALALFSIGVGVGSMLCEKLSGRTVEIGLVPLGALGMTVFLVDLYVARPAGTSASGLDVAGFLASPGGWRVAIDLTGIGLFAGFYIVPLFALIQSRTPKGELSRVIAGMNIQNAAFVVLAALLALALQQQFGWSLPEVLLALAVANAVVAVYIFSIVPEFAMRFGVWIAINLLYRVKVEGVEENVPDEGPALIVCNHVSFVDALVLGGSIPRPVRFVMYYKIHRLPVLGWVFRTARTIPIAGRKEDPVLMEQAFDAVREALRNGEVVGIFPEGGLTRDGDIAPFRQGVERILAETPVPVVPMAITGLWESMWSRRDSALRRMRLPRRLRAHIGVMAGPALAPTSTAAELEAAVRALRGDRA
jgi:1-acyl-sn-glycerol-3-phosphate acyltransferase